ncbi:hypothetical protein HNV10_15965 [Winogradskyella litoriviva]|uniref:DUF3278 domain-containing protein n=1 Tax=Winogradskyella litoriviva TaxID=1220182 RepID=A0ABX2E8H6_9FLAO|nr:hypothetical protein [Winogradskyella litoriviva]NRD24750.1 hypothetical protein [Winogradskyella litoriviva]
MKNLNSQKQDTFQAQLAKFKKLLVGAEMAKLSSIILIVVSLVLAYKSRENSFNVMLLLIGVLSLVFFIDKFLSIKDIKQKSYTQTSLVSSISKLKSYMAKRKKYEMYFMAFWILTLIPSATTYFESNIIGAIGVVLYIAIVAFMGNLAYKKTDKEIALLENTMENELQLQ